VYKKSLSFLLVSILFIFCFTFYSFAYSFRGSDKDIGGGVFGSVSWKKAVANIEERLSKQMSDAYLSESETYLGLAWKESTYLYYVCTTQGQPYDTYLDYAKRFFVDYDSVNTSFKIYPQDEYNIRLNGAKIDQNFNAQGDLIADSGFRPSKNGLPFYNFGFNWGYQTGGLCAGFSWFSLQNYLHGETNFVFTIADNYVKKHSDVFIGIQDNTLDLSDISSVVNRNLYSYVPDTKYLNSKLPKTSYLYDENNWGLSSRLITAPDLVGTNDWKMVKALSLSGITAWEISNNIDDYLSYYDEYESYSIPCLAKELNEVIKELQQGHPVYMQMLNPDGTGAHAVVVYAISRDEINQNKYYLYLYDSNHPGNYTYSGAINLGDWYYAEIAVVKSSDGEDYLYCNYEAMKGVADTLYTTNLSVSLRDRYVGNFEFIDYNGNSLHVYKNGNKKGQRVMTHLQHSW
jgi:hypothetical protein